LAAYHPNTDGYRAMTAALVGWSRLATAAQKPLPPGPERRWVPDASSASVARLDLSSGVATEPVVGGSRYTVAAGSLAPHSAFLLQVESDPTVLLVGNASAEGSIEAEVLMPIGLPVGDHRLRLVALDREDQPYQSVQGVALVKPISIWVWILAVFSAALVLGGVVGIRRRPD
jgi:hypothetical protein